MKTTFFWCPTSEDAKELFKYLDSKGIRWSDGERASESTTYWDSFGPETCYAVFNQVHYITTKDCLKAKIKFIPWKASSIRKLLLKREI